MYENPNGRMMESDGGASITDVRARDGMRQSVFRSYVYPYMDRPNLTVLSEALANRVTLEGKRAVGIEIVANGELLRIATDLEVVHSPGAVHMPKVLMQSGIGDRAALEALDLPVVRHLPGVGRNLQDHVAFDCVWEYSDPRPPRNNLSEAIIFWKSRPELTSPDLLICEAEVPKSTAENIAKYGLRAAGWRLFGTVAHPTSIGRLHLSGPGPSIPSASKPTPWPIPET